MNPTKHRELLDFWEYEHGFDNEDGATSIDEDISYEASRQELQIELEHFNEMDLDQELHPIKDDDFQPEDEHSNKTMLKRELRAIALKRLEDSARTVSDFEEVIKEWDHLDDNRERKHKQQEGCGTSCHYCPGSYQSCLLATAYEGRLYRHHF